MLSHSSVKREHLPNQLTILRAILAGVFFIVLNQYRYPDTNTWALWVANGIFIVAAITDWLDGYFARKWQVESTFGRIMDPFCDKLLVLGAFLYLAGPRFLIPEAVEAGQFTTMISGVYPWMVVVMLARELLVTGIRGEMEGRGMKFGAKTAGKLKTIFQLVITPLILVIIWLDPYHNQDLNWLGWVRDVLVYLTVSLTVVSAWPYISATMKAAGSEETQA